MKKYIIQEQRCNANMTDFWWRQEVGSELAGGYDSLEAAKAACPRAWRVAQLGAPQKAPLTNEVCAEESSTLELMPLETVAVATLRARGDSTLYRILEVEA